MPNDPTPHAGQVMERPPEPEYPEPKPAGTADEGREPARAHEKREQRSRVDPLTGAGEDIAG